MKQEVRKLLMAKAERIREDSERAANYSPQLLKTLRSARDVLESYDNDPDVQEILEEIHSVLKKVLNVN